MIGASAATNALVHDGKTQEQRDEELREEHEKQQQIEEKARIKYELYLNGRATSESSPRFLRWYVELADSMFLITRKKAWFENFILAFIFGSSVTISISTYDHLKDNTVLHRLNQFILMVFIAEVIMKVVAEEFRPWLYFLGPFRFW
jgi:hypothetical protein